MSCCAKDVAKARAAAPDPTKHVNYTQGMVLGVDDFTQEFAYLSGRDQWLARDLIGYGTARGLAVSWDAPKTTVKVTAGVGLSPCGQLVCVREDQCADMNKWLAGHGEEVSKLLGAETSGAITLHAVLSYRDCPTDAVPIPGEPCRSEDELKAPSRIADDFLLELAFDPPLQKEEDALREFEGWLRSMPVVNDAASTDIVDFRKAVQAWIPGTGAPTALVVRPADVDLYLREALRIWVTELRPKSYGRTCGCAPSKDAKDTDDRLLLATLECDVELPVGQSWRVKTLKEIDESRRPLLIHLRALQEIVPASPAPVYRVVAAGHVSGDDMEGKTNYGKLRVASIKDGEVIFTFDGYLKPDGTFQYVVKCHAVAAADLKFLPTIRFIAPQANSPDGILCLVKLGAKPAVVEQIKKLSFMLEVSAFPVQP